MEFSNKRQFILQGKMWRVILTLAAPLMANNLIQTLYNLGDTYWVSKLGSVEIAAMGLVFPFIYLIISLGMGMNVAGTALISQYVGSENKDEAGKIAGQLFSFSLILSVILGILGYFMTPHLIRMIGGKGALLKASTDYLSIMFWDMPIMYLFFVYNAIKQGQGDTVTPTILNVCGVVLNIILDPIFIFRFGLGIKGAAYATILSRGIFAIYAIYSLFSDKNSIYITRKMLKLNKILLAKIIKVGLPASLGQSASALGFIILNGFVMSYGEATLAAFTIGNRINSLVLMPIMGIGSSIATIIGQNLGADQIQRAKEAFKTSILLSTSFMIVGALLLYAGAGQIVGIFTKDALVLSEGVQYTHLISLGLPFMGIFQILVGTFQGSGHTIYGMAMDIGRLWVFRIPMIVLFKRYADWGSSSVWYAMVLSNLLVCLLGYGIYLQGSWQQKVIDKKENVLV